MSEHVLIPVDLTQRYLVIVDGGIVGSVTVKSERPAWAAQAWRDENRPGATLGLIMGGEDESFLDKLPHWNP